MSSPLLNAYKQGTKEYEIARDNYEYGYQQGKKDVIDTIKKHFKSKTTRTLNEIEIVILLRELKRKENDMLSFTSGNADDITKAVEGLDQFTKNWCMNCEETEKQEDLIFRCSECEFKTEGGKCLIKTFAKEHEHNYPLKDFGSMGEH